MAAEVRVRIRVRVRVRVRARVRFHEILAILALIRTPILSNPGAKPNPNHDVLHK